MILFSLLFLFLIPADHGSISQTRALMAHVLLQRLLRNNPPSTALRCSAASLHSFKVMPL